MDEATRNGSVTHEGWRVKKDGRRFWGLVAITALHNKSGDIVGYSKVTRDLTDRKAAEDRVANMVEELSQANEQLKQSEERYQKMIEEVQDYAILLLNQEGIIQNWNSGAQVIKGYTASEIIGKSFSIFYQKKDKDAGLPMILLEKARKNGKVTNEGWRVRKDGTLFWGSVVITALHNSQGNIIGFSKVTRDLTERKHAEEALRHTAAQLDLKNKTLERLNNELASFSYIASHDLREPLRKIQIFGARMEEAGGLPEASKGFLDKILQSAVRMQKLIQDLLIYSEVSNMDEKAEDVDLNEVLAGIKTDLEVVINEKQAVIQSKSLPKFKGAVHQYNQLFFNLISNALKFSRPDVPPVITINSKIIKGPEIPGELIDGENRYYQISVKDNGIGFEPEFSNKIFQAFQRLHSKQEYSGTGIGLAIVKKVVENHHGIIEAQSTPGVGSTFNIYLPADVK